MNLPEIYVIRHGETEWNRMRRWQGALDSPLTDVGVRQAEALGQALRDMGVTPATHSFDVSPQGRARATARLILGDDTARVDERLREIDVGAWSGRQHEEIVSETELPVHAHFLELYARAPDGEPFDTLFARVSAYLGDLAGPTVIITHGMTSRFLRAAALGGGIDGARKLSGGQGNIHHIKDGLHRTIELDVD